jgi:endonuclease/exonuclease/phosphatase family metal-dependent hydrolase
MSDLDNNTLYLNLMISTTNILQKFSKGCPCVPVDGDAAVQEEQTVLCPEAYSIKLPKSPGGMPTGPRIPTDYKAPTKLGRKAGSSSDVGNKEEGRHQTGSTLESELRRLQNKKDEIWSGINKKRGIRIATLNIKGRNNKYRGSKWPTVVTLMRKQRIAIMGLQETHLNNEEAEKLRKMCPKIEIISNGISTAKEGVAFVINKEMANKMTWSHTPIIEGRASRLTVEIEGDRGLDIVLIYAPNSDNEKIRFFSELKEKLSHEENMNNIIIMGDFNCVEHELDRFPHRGDDKRVTQSWIEIKKKYKLVDGWRIHNELNKGYTYIQSENNSMSRIDRIYMNNEIYPYGYNWEHVSSAQLSDHDLAIADILKEKLPYIGKGLWRMNIDDIEDAITRKTTSLLLERAESEMKILVKENKGGIQELWMETKEEIRELVNNARIERKHDLAKNKKQLKKEIHEKLKAINRETQETNERNQEELVSLKEKLAKTIRKELHKLQKSTRARYRSKGEKYTKYWFKINKEKVDDNIILALQKKNGTLTDKTKEMMKIALEHHEELQKRPEMNEDRREAIRKIKETSKLKTSEGQKAKLNKKTTYDEIEISLKKAPNGSAPGLDGIIYEFYKDKMKDHEIDEKKPDVIGMLHMVINDIETNGLKILNKDNNGKRKKEFTDGIMHLIFKKKEKWKIANYRPITLLNTDYKTYTKTIALRLAEVAGSLIHEDQAGFVPNRSLYDHTKTTNLAIEFCDMMDKNGCIIALDQEKAYDKIDHDYLWQILEHYEFPTDFINRIKELYKDTGKAIIVNGVMTEQYKVERGVHQGDPMSCLLYNFAIEPLADAIRESSLKGIEINKNVKRLIVSLFADDTLVYLREADDMSVLKKIIDTFCEASTARFNMEKTEYLPIGNKAFRKEVLESRKMGFNKIEEGVTIVKDGEAMRTLGAWVGNETQATLQWEKILEKQEESINRWKKTNMSFKGKEIILKALIQSKAIFLATVNGMPVETEDRMKKMFKDFIWDDKKRGLMTWNQIIAPRDQGGLGMPDIRTRVEAIEVMWIKKWLAPENSKTKWTHILDEILNNSIAKSPMVDPESRMNWIKQSWHESEAKNINLSKGVKNMLKIARKYNITLEPLKYDIETKNNEPLWHNRLMTEANYQWNKKSARCLRSNHGVRTIGDLNAQNEMTNAQDEITKCNNTKACYEMTKRLIGMIPEIINPLQNTPQKVRRKNLDLTPTRKKRNELNSKEKTFNPDITAKGDILDQIRIFGAEKGSKTRGKKIKPKSPAYRIASSSNKIRVKARILVVTQNEGKPNQETKISIKLSRGSKEKTMFQLTKKDQSEEKATATAILWVLSKAKHNKLTIITSSQRIVKWLGNDINIAEDHDWLKTKEPELWKTVLNLLRKRNGKTKVRMANKKEMKSMKKLKRRLKAEKNLKTMKIRINNDEKYVNKGARLSALTQKAAYELILRQKIEKPGGAQSWKRMNRIKENLENKWGINLSSEKIWNNLENINNRKIQDFIWKLIHDRIKCGKFFQHIPNWQDKQFCKCGQVENMEHILLQCKENNQEKLWKKVKKIWKLITNLKWKTLNIEDIMGVGSLKVKGNTTNKELRTEVLITLITTAVWSLWKNRNDRVFNEARETKKKQRRTWIEGLKKEIETEFEQTKLVEFKNRQKATIRFMKKWTSSTNVVRVEQDLKGHRRLMMNI